MATPKEACAESSPVANGYRALMEVEPGWIAKIRPFSILAISWDCNSIVSFGSFVRSIADPSDWIPSTLNWAGYRVVAIGLSGRILSATDSSNEEPWASAAGFATHSRA
jgi:hypothetical protein